MTGVYNMLSNMAARNDRRICTLAFLFAALMFASCTQKPRHEESQKAGLPNILLIMADDMGYSDLGSYGSEINTPNLDRLAERGIRMTSYYAAARCNPTRAMLMSGKENSLSGLGPRRGYHLDPNFTSLGTAMRNGGYRTYYSGKWDLGAKEGLRPADRGFDRSFALLPGAMSHYDETPHANRGPVVFSKNGEPANLSEDYYSTRFFTSELLSFIGEDSPSPFFAILSYTAPHWPLQVEKSYYEPYLPVYADGWEKIRERRIQKMRELGILQNKDSVSEYPALRSWAALSEAEQRYEIKRMAIYAGMMTYMDAQIGSVLRHLEEIGELDNTIVVFKSDNGGEGEPLEKTPVVVEFGEAGFDNSYEKIGQKGSYQVLGPDWARVINVPFAKWKGYSFEGGIAAPMIVVMPGDKRAGQIDRSFFHVTDVMPSFLEAANVPQEKWPGGLTGHSAYSLWTEGRDFNTDRVQGWFYSHDPDKTSAIRKGHWKVLWHNGQAKLFDLRHDRGETKNLAQERPEMLASLLADWKTYKAQNNISHEDTNEKE